MVPDGTDLQGGIALAILGARLSDSTPAAGTFWRALGGAVDRNARVVRGLVAHTTTPPASAPAPTPAPAAALTAAQMFERVFSGFAGAERTSSKMLTLQKLYPDNVLYTNELAVGAGAFDDATKRSVESRAPDYGGGSGGGRPGSGSAGGGGGGGGSSDSGLLAAALDSAKLPETKGEDGHARVVPLPKDMLPTTQAELLVAKRSILESAVSLGQTPAVSEPDATKAIVVYNGDAVVPFSSSSSADLLSCQDESISEFCAFDCAAGLGGVGIECR